MRVIFHDCISFLSTHTYSRLGLIKNCNQHNLQNIIPNKHSVPHEHVHNSPRSWANNIQSYGSVEFVSSYFVGLNLEYTDLSDFSLER